MAWRSGQRTNTGRACVIAGGSISGESRLPTSRHIPFTKVAVDHAALDYEMADHPEHRDLAVFEEDGEPFSRYYQIPTSADDLLKRSELIAVATAAGATLVLLIKRSAPTP